MLGDIVGYAMIAADAKLMSAAPDSDFQKQVVRVLEFGIDNSVLAINREASAIAMIEPKGIVKSFKCSKQGDVICPPNLSYLDQMIYVSKALSRKGGYNYMVGQMVIAASLHKGEFDDSILWIKQ